LSSAAAHVGFEDATHADARLLVEWVRSRRNYGALIDQTAARRLSRWHSAVGRVSFADVDEVLTRLGFHVSEVPEECWIRDERWLRAKEMIERGMSPSRVGREMGVPAGTVASWGRQAARS
jgi:hypothetical protein